MLSKQMQNLRHVNYKRVETDRLKVAMFSAHNDICVTYHSVTWYQLWTHKLMLPYFSNWQIQITGNTLYPRTLG